MQRVSDSVAILSNGELVTCGPIEHILNAQDGIVYSVTTKGYLQSMERLLLKQDWVTHVALVHNNGFSNWQISVNDEAAAEANLLRQVLQDPQVTVTAFSRKKYELEEVFMNLVEGGSNDRK